MIDRVTSLLDNRTGEVLTASIRTQIRLGEFKAIAQEWDQSKMRYREVLKRSGASLPPNDAWDWQEKASATTPDLHRFVGVSRHDEMHGLMMLANTPEFSRRKYHEHEHVLYIEYLESAPWNLPAYAGIQTRYSGVGSSLLAAAVEISIECGWEGRLALHSLGAAHGFYLKAGFENLGLDESENLDWFELAGVSIEEGGSDGSA